MGWYKAVANVSNASLAAALASSQYWPQWFGERWWLPLPAVGCAFFGALAPIGLERINERHNEERRSFFIKQAVEPRWESLKTQDPSARLNVMLSRARVWPPFSRLCVVRHFGFAENHRDGALELAKGSGIAGLAYELETWVLGLCIEEQVLGVNAKRCYVLCQKGPVSDCRDVVVTDIAHGLSSDQRAATQDLRFIISYPVRRLESRHGDVGATGPVIGVINVDSTAILHYVELSAAGEVVALTDLTKTLTNELLPKLAAVAGWVFG